jgi:hypothetical protein
VSGPDRLGVINAMDDPANVALIEEMISRMRMALGPMLNAAMEDGDEFSKRQSMMISASAMFAGLAVGHMIAVGSLRPQDKARASKVVTVAFRNAIKLGEREARQAMLEQMPSEGQA